MYQALVANTTGLIDRLGNSIMDGPKLVVVLGWLLLLTLFLSALLFGFVFGLWLIAVPLILIDLAWESFFLDALSARK